MASASQTVVFCQFYKTLNEIVFEMPTPHLSTIENIIGIKDENFQNVLDLLRTFFFSTRNVISCYFWRRLIFPRMSTLDRDFKIDLLVLILDTSCGYCMKCVYYRILPRWSTLAIIIMNHEVTSYYAIAIAPYCSTGVPSDRTSPAGLACLKCLKQSLKT